MSSSLTLSSRVGGAATTDEPTTADGLATTDGPTTRSEDAASGAAAHEHSGPGACPNCGAERVGRYCHGCGQRLSRGRLTTSELWREAVRTLFDADFRLWRTLADLTLRPGHTIRAYLDGQRRRYTNPFAFVALGSTLYLLVFSWLGGFEMIDAVMAEQASEAYASMPEAERALVRDLTRGLVRSMLLTTLATVVPFSGMMWFLMRGPTLNLAESSVFSLYALGHPIYLSLPPTVAMLALDTDPAVQSGVVALVYFAVLALAGYQFFGRSLAKALLLVALYVFVFFGFMFGAGVLIGVYLAVLS